MKKMLFGAAMLCVALTGCENEDFTAANQSQVMRFDAPAMMKTRANVQGEIIGTLYDFREDFKVYSKSYKGDFAGWEAGTEDYFQAAGDVAKNQGNESKYWYTENVYYWPEIDYNLAFAAYSPAAFGTAAAGATVSHTPAGLQIQGFKTEVSANDQYDLMYSDRVVDRNKSNNGSSAVPLVFHHALSSIVFSTEKEDESVNYEITSVKLHGKFIQQADFNQNIDEATDKLSGEAKWVNPAAATEADFTPTISATGKVDVTTVPTQFTQKESALLLIPQAVPAESYITVVYNKITNPGTALEKLMVNTATIKLTDFAQEGGNKITEWEMGKRYVYRIAFGQNKRIYFEPTTTDWVTVPTLIYTIQ
ncbi:MAG: fimbrillin family protein [Bacteroidaceae bacterium]|nr:fimbrillin family protein [Bacteroidaceae bacterium]